jgi:hypothetical protein
MSAIDLDVGPAFATLRSADRHGANAVLSCEIFETPADEFGGTNVFDGGVRQLRSSVLLASMMWYGKFRAVTHRICLIVLICIPSKIADGVIGRIPITVACLHPFWPRADEGNKHERMNPLRALDAIYGQIHKYALEPFAKPVRNLLQHFTFERHPVVSSPDIPVERTNLTFRACLITGISRDTLPHIRSPYYVRLDSI